MSNIGLDHNDYDEVEIPNSAWREINRKQLSIHNILGSGQFGEVAKGDLTEEDGAVVPCAVKTLKGWFECSSSLVNLLRKLVNFQASLILQL